MDADTNICAVILNYNDAQTTKKLAESWKDSRAIHNIIIVDNCSTDDSWEQLQVLKDEKVELIRTEKMAVMATATIQGSAMPSSTTELPMCWWQTRTWYFPKAA